MCVSQRILEISARKIPFARKPRNDVQRSRRYDSSNAKGATSSRIKTAARRQATMTVLPIASEYLSVDTIWLVLMTVFYPLTWLLIPWILLKRVVHPSARIAWILTIVFIPVVGGMLAVVLGVNRIKRGESERQKAARELNEFLPEPQSAVPPSETVHRRLRDLASLAYDLTGEPLVADNEVTILNRTPEAFARLEAGMRGAKESLHVLFYIWRADKIGNRLRDVMIEKAREGLEVRFLYDGIGSMSLGRKTLRQMRDAGVKVAPWAAGQSLRDRWSVNLRNHRKIVVVDGDYAFTGGMNVGDEYLGRDPTFGFWRDTFVELVGPAAARLQVVFTRDWYQATGEALTRPMLYRSDIATGDAAVQSLSGGPDDDKPVFWTLFFAAITAASERVTLSTGYFVPPDPLLMAMVVAAERGVKVRLLTAGKNTYLHTLWAGRAYYVHLLRAGAEVYEYQRGLFHAKTMVIDGCWWCVGTPNLDMRSLMLNFEDAVCGYSTTTAQELERQFDEDVKYSRRIDPEEWEQRGVRHRLAEETCRLISPVL
jgi:cardiolipin synthase